MRGRTLHNATLSTRVSDSSSKTLVLLSSPSCFNCFSPGAVAVILHMGTHLQAHKLTAACAMVQPAATRARCGHGEVKRVVRAWVEEGGACSGWVSAAEQVVV